MFPLSSHCSSRLHSTILNQGFSVFSSSFSSIEASRKSFQPRLYSFKYRTELYNALKVNSNSNANAKGWFVCNGISGSRDGNSSLEEDINDGFEIDANEIKKETRMERISKALYEDFKVRWSEVRERLPAKIFLILFGFFCANTLSTIIGQTGDWDVLVAGILVSVLESLAYFIYGKQRTKYFGYLQRLLKFLNYWKVGLVLGLFVDAFKVGS